MRNEAGMKFECIFEEPLDFIDIDYTHLNKTIRYEQRPRGEWLFVQRGKFVDLVCPFCKEVSIDDLAYNITAEEAKRRFYDGEYTIHGKTELPNFCPKCGAPMNEKALEILRKREGEKNESDHL